MSYTAEKKTTQQHALESQWFSLLCDFSQHLQTPHINSHLLLFYASSSRTMKGKWPVPPSVRVRVTYNHQHNSGQSSKFPDFAPDAVLINYSRRAGSLHTKAFWLLKWLLCSGHVQGPGMQRCCSGYEKRGQRNSAQGGRQKFFALLPHVQISGDKAD